jgi:hypothetical protein
VSPSVTWGKKENKPKQHVKFSSEFLVTFLFSDRAFLFLLFVLEEKIPEKMTPQLGEVVCKPNHRQINFINILPAKKLPEDLH